MGQEGVEGFYPADRWQLRVLGFFFLFEIEGEEKEDEADHLIGGCLQKALEWSGVQKVIFGDDLNAVIADNFS